MCRWAKRWGWEAALAALLLWWLGIAWAGAPEPNQAMKQMWVQDTLDRAQHGGAERDLGLAILLSIVREFGVWKTIAALLLMLLMGLAGTVFAVLKFFQRKT